jgi:hypothetical protein
MFMSCVVLWSLAVGCGSESSSNDYQTLCNNLCTKDGFTHGGGTNGTTASCYCDSGNSTLVQADCLENYCKPLGKQTATVMTFGSSLVNLCKCQ